jgi:hypothetical protein
VCQPARTLGPWVSVTHSPQCIPLPLFTARSGIRPTDLSAIPAIPIPRALGLGESRVAKMTPTLDENLPIRRNGSQHSEIPRLERCAAQI